MLNINLLKPKTVAKLETATRKFVAGVTIVMSVFYGTLYYALITLASEDDRVPKPLASQAFDMQKEPEKFFLESLVERKSSKVKNTASISNDNYQEFETENKKVFEPTATKVKNKLYVPFRLVVASGSNNLEIELKSKKGTQKIVLQNDSFDYAIFEKQKKNFTKLADMKNIFQFSEFASEPIMAPPAAESSVPTPEPSVIETPIITVEPSPSEFVETPVPLPTETPLSSPEVIPEVIPEVTPEITPTTLPETNPSTDSGPSAPEPSPQSFFNRLFNTANAVDTQDITSQIWQEIILTRPVSTSWAIENQLLTINQEADFNLGTVSFSAWARVKLGYENSQRINSWEYGVSRSDGLVLDNYTFRLKYDAALVAVVKSKNESAGELELMIEKDEDEPSENVADIESELSETNEPQADEEPITEEVSESPPLEPAATSSSLPLTGQASPSVTPSEILEMPFVSSEPETTPTAEEPVTTPHFEISPTPSLEATEGQGIPTETIPAEPNPSTDSQPTPELTPTPEPTPAVNPETEPTSLNYLLNELLGIETARADEASPAESVPASDVAPVPDATIPSEDAVPVMDSTDSPQAEITTEPVVEQGSEEIEEPIEEPAEEPTPELAPDPIIEGLGNITETITDGISSFVTNSSISAPVLEEVTLASNSFDQSSQPEETDLSEPPPLPLPLTAQIIEAISLLNPLPQADALDFKLNFNFGPGNEGNILLDEKTGHLTALILLSAPDSAERGTLLEDAPLEGHPLETPTSFLDLRKLLGIQTVHAEIAPVPQINSTVLATISDIGVAVYDDGIWVASGDGSKNTDFKIHFNPILGGAIDQLYLGTDFATNKVTKPQAGSGGLTLLEQDKRSQAETKSSTLEVLEQSKVRIVVRNIFSLGNKADIEERYAIYATGRIIKSVIYDKKKAGEERWYLNATKSGFDLATGYNETQLIINTKLEPNSKDLMLVWQDPGSVTSSSFEVGEASDSYLTLVKSTRQPLTYTEYQMIDLMQEDLSVVDKTAIDERAADYRNPDKPEFALGRFIQVNKQFQSYEMESAANQNRVIFSMDGSQTPRFQPVFEIHDWENPDLNGVKAALNQRSMIENRDYIVDFRNGDPMTGILIFHFLGTLRANSEFSADGFGVFDIDPEVAPGEGILAYGGGNTNTSTVTTGSTGAVFGAFASISASTFSPFWVVNRASPVGGSQASGSDNEHLVGSLNGTGVLEMLRWDGTTWALEWTENNVGSQSLDARAYDIAYENSGEAVAAWSITGTANPELEYRVWDGISWGASASFDLPTNGTGGNVTWVEMASHPASGSNQNEIGMCYVTDGGGTEVGCAIWNGTTNTWGNEVIRESNAEENGSSYRGTNKTVSAFYEQSSGEFVALSGVELAAETDSTQPQIIYSTWDGSSWTATSSYGPASTNKDGASTLVCSPAPFSLNSTTTKNKAICGAEHLASSDTWSFVWDGSAPVSANNNTELSAPANNVAMTVATAWIIDTRAMGVMAFSTNDTGGLDFDYWDDTADAWTLGTALAHVTANDRNYVGFSNPYQKNTATLFLLDQSGDIYGYEASVSGTTVTLSCLNNDGTSACSTTKNRITADGVSGAGLPVGMAYDLFPNPTQNHYQWLNDSGGLNSGTAAASQDTQFTGLATSTIKRLRVEISNEGAASKSPNFQLEFAKKGSGCTEPTLSDGWRYREIHTDAVTASDAFDIELTANFANGDATTASLSAEDPTFVAGQGIESASSTSAITLNGNNYTEIEYSLQANSNAQASTDYCFRLTDGGSSTSFTYQKYAEVQTAAAAAVSPTYTQDFFRFYVNADLLTPTDVWPTGSADLAENATMSAHFASVASGSITRVRTNVLVSGDPLTAASQTFQFQYAQGFKCGAIAGGSWATVGASTSNTIWRFGSNAGVTDGTTLASPVLLSNSTDGARATYEEGNPSAVNPNAVAATERMEHDWSLQNNGAVSGASYCFRIIRTSGTVFETYNYFPLIILGPSTDQVLRHGAFFSEGYEQGYYWSGI